MGIILLVFTRNKQIKKVHSIQHCYGCESIRNCVTIKLNLAPAHRRRGGRGRDGRTSRQPTPPPTRLRVRVLNHRKAPLCLFVSLSLLEELCLWVNLNSEHEKIIYIMF